MHLPVRHGLCTWREPVPYGVLVAKRIQAQIQMYGNRIKLCHVFPDILKSNF